MIKKISAVLIFLILFCMTAGIKCSAYENEWIYYSNTNGVGRLYKIKKDGSGMKRLSMQTAYDIEVLGEWVYYFNNSQNATDIAVCNDRIYFVEMYIENLSPIEYHVFGIDLDGENLTAYMNGHDNINAVEAYGEYLFLRDYAEDSYVCRV